MSSPENHPVGISPINPVPPVILAIFVMMMAAEALFQLGARGVVGGAEGVGWRSSAIRDYGFNTDVMVWMVENGRFPAEHVKRFFTYVFVHGGFTHALFAGAMLLALGKFVGEIFSQWATLALFVVSSTFGALVYGLLITPAQPWLIGAFPGVYGLIGGFTYVMWLRLGQMGARQARAFSLIGFLLGIQLVFGLLFGANAEWLADLSGFAAGFLLSFFLSPGGWAKIRARIRHQ